MDTYQIIINAIGTLGFPIVCSLGLFWKMNKQDEDHKLEMQQMTEAINNNTLTMQRLLDKLDK